MPVQNVLSGLVDFLVRLWQSAAFGPAIICSPATCVPSRRLVAGGPLSPDKAQELRILGLRFADLGSMLRGSSDPSRVSGVRIVAEPLRRFGLMLRAVASISGTRSLT